MVRWGTTDRSNDSDGVTVYKSGGKKRTGEQQLQMKPPGPKGLKGPGAGGGGGPDMEREVFLGNLQRSVAEAHRCGDFGRALELATHAQEELEDYFGKDHPVVASAWNNVALMLKRLGRFDDAVDGYNHPVIAGHSLTSQWKAWAD
jgi:hypothetical protein